MIGPCFSRALFFFFLFFFAGPGPTFSYQDDIHVIMVVGCKDFTYKLDKMSLLVRPGGELETRLKRAVDIWQATSKNVRIVVSGGRGVWKDNYVEPQFASTSAVMKNYLIVNGVPEKVILEDCWSLTTIECGAFSRYVLKQQGLLERVKSILLITNDLHIIRTGRVLTYFFPSVFVLACPGAQDMKGSYFRDRVERERTTFKTFEAELTTKFTPLWEPTLQELEDRSGGLLLVKRLSKTSLQLQRNEFEVESHDNCKDCTIACLKKRWDSSTELKVFGWKTKDSFEML